MFWQRHSFIRLAIPLTLGVIGANAFAKHLDVTVLFLLAAIVLSILFFFVKTQTHPRRDTWFGAIAMFLCVLVGMALSANRYHHIARGVAHCNDVCTGTLVEAPTEKQRSWALKLRQADANLLLLYVGKGHNSAACAALHPGDTILARTSIFTPMTVGFSESDTFASYHRYLFHHGVCATAYARSDEWTVKACTTPYNTPSSLASTFASLRERLHQIYLQNGIDSDSGHIVEALTIGRKDELTHETRQNYSRAGVSHMLALSGFHIGIIVYMLQCLFLANILPYTWRGVTHVLMIIILWAFTLLAGASPSLVRAVTMFSIFLICQLLSRNASSLNSCTIAFVAMLCYDPLLLYDIGFQLSFISVAAILLCQKQLTVICPPHKYGFVATWTINSLAISLLCTLVTTPLVAHHFGYFPLFSIVCTLLFSVLIHILLWGAILWWSFLWCDTLSDALASLLKNCAATMNNCAEYVANLPFSTVTWRPDTFTTCLCYILLLIIVYFTNHKAIQIHEKRHLVGSPLQ